MAFPIRWGKPAPRVERMHFVDPDKDTWVYMLHAPKDFHTIHLHWLNEANESGICPGETCPLLGMTRHFESCYCAVLEYNPRKNTWTKAILGIGDPGHHLANTNYRGQVIQVGRSRVPNEKRIIYLQTAKTVDPLIPKPAPLFDVRPHLLRRWGLFAEADLVGCELHSPPQEDAARQTESDGDA
jgi:hypothetical protein